MARVYSRRAEELLQHDVHSPHHLGQEEVVARLVEHRLLLLIPARRPGRAETLGRRALGGGILSRRGAEAGSGGGSESVAGGGLEE